MLKSVRKTWEPAGISPPVLAFLLSLACLPVFLSPCRAAFGPGGSLPVGTVSLPYVQWSTSANGGLGGWIIVGTYPLSHLGTQAANTVLAGPASGATAASVTARALVPLDIPAGLAGTGLTSTAGVLSVTAPVPTGTDTQTLRYSGTAITATSALLNNGTQIGVGVAPTTTDRVSVNPSAAAENGVTVTMPSGTTGNPLSLKNSTGGLWSVDSTGRITVGSGQTFALRNSTGSDVLTLSNSYLQFPFAPTFQTGNVIITAGGLQVVGGASGTVGLFTASYNSQIPVNNSVALFGFQSSSSVPLTLKGQSGQAVALLDTVSSTGSTHYFQVMPTGHLILGGTIPTLTNGGNAASATITAGSTDAKGDCTVTTTAAPTSATTLISVVYAAAYATAPEVYIMAYGPNAASALLYVSARSTTGFTLTSVNAPPASTTVLFGYMVIQ